MLMNNLYDYRRLRVSSYILILQILSFECGRITAGYPLMNTKANPYKNHLQNPHTLPGGAFALSRCAPKLCYPGIVHTLTLW